MTVRRYEREYHNPTGPSANTFVTHDYDQTKPAVKPKPSEECPCAQCRHS